MNKGVINIGNPLQNLYDKRVIAQVLGCIANDPDLLSNSVYKLDNNDFYADTETSFYQLIFSTISNLYFQGANIIDAFAIDSYISKFPKQYDIFNSYQGVEYIDNVKELAESDNFEYNYKALRKYTMLRDYEKLGVDTTCIYNTNLVSPTEIEKEQSKFFDTDINDILNAMENKICINMRLKYECQLSTTGGLAGEGIHDIIQDCFKEPEIGISMQSKLMNNLLRGARLGTVYLRSGGTGSGKTRLGIGDICSYSVPWFYDTDKKEWHYTGQDNPSLIISCELSKKEIKLIMLAYISGVDEDHIVTASYKQDEYERVKQAADYIASSPLFIEELPDFNIDDITYIIKKYKREHGVQYIDFDYMHTSIKLIMQISQISRGMRLREDQVLYMLSDRLKRLANEEQIHIDTSTQLNSEFKTQKYKDQDSLRGAKSIPDRFDVAYIAAPITDNELKAIDPILTSQYTIRPTLTKNNCMVYHVYKVRAGRLTRIKVFLKVDLGTGRVQDLFCTTYDNEFIPVEKLEIEQVDKTIEEHSIAISKDVDIEQLAIQTFNINNESISINEETGEIQSVDIEEDDYIINDDNINRNDNDNNYKNDDNNDDNNENDENETQQNNKKTTTKIKPKLLDW